MLYGFSINSLTTDCMHFLISNKLKHFLANTSPIPTTVSYQGFFFFFFYNSYCSIKTYDLLKVYKTPLKS